MPFILRRVFYAKVGFAEPLVAHFQVADALMKKYGVAIESRILTDHNSGRSDRVVVEWDADDPGDLDAALERLMSNEQAAAEFGPWMGKMNEMIHYSDAETWHIK